MTGATDPTGRDVGNAGGPGAGPQQRVRVTAPRMAARPVTGSLSPRRKEIDEQTGVGEVYMRSLMRAQLRLGISVLAVVTIALGSLPILFADRAPAERHRGSWPRCRCPGSSSGVSIYPLLVARRLVARPRGGTGRARLRRDRRAALTGGQHRGTDLAPLSSPWSSCASRRSAWGRSGCACRGRRPTSTSRAGWSAPRWNASAIGGEYLSAASFLGVAGLVLAFGADILWYPVGYTAGYLVLLALVAAPLRRSGAYTLPDFAEIRLRSRSVRRLSSMLVVAIGWLYLLPQFEGAGLALRTVTGAPGWLGSLLVAVVVMANVVAGGMRSITIVQAFQFWLKLTAIAVPVLILAGHRMAVGRRPGPVPAAASRRSRESRRRSGCRTPSRSAGRRGTGAG